MGDGEPPPEPPERGGRDDAEEIKASFPGTPLALNDAHASQASKELTSTAGIDLEAFLQSADFRAFLATSDKENFFAVQEPTNRGGGRSRPGKPAASRRGTHPRSEQRKSATLPRDESLDQAADTPASPGQGDDAGGASAPESSANQAPPNDTKPEAQALGAARVASGPAATNKRKNRGRKPKAGAEETASTDAQEPAADPAPTKATREANVWSQARKVLLRQQVETQVEDLPYDDLRRYQKYYAIAQRSDYRVIPDGRPRRPITEDELQTLFLWRTKRIHLVQPPKFVDETHTLKERLMFDQIQRDLLTYSLHIDLPGRVRMPVETVKFHFYSRLLARNQSPSGPTDRVINLMADVLSISVSATSRRAILNFDRPEKRDKWEGEVLAFPFGSVTLRAGSYFEQEDKKHGIDQDTVKLLYSYYFIGRPDLALTAVHDMAIELNGGTPILKIEPIEPTGAQTLDPHMWKITLNSLDAPPGLEKIRELTVLHGEQQFNIGVHQPRLATRVPCSICLETSHFRNKCPNKETAKDKRRPFTRVISIPATKTVDHEPAATDVEGFSRQLAKMRAAIEPELAAAAECKMETDPPAGGQAKPVEKAKPASPAPKKSTSSAMQLDIILKAKKEKKTGSAAKVVKPRKKKSKQAGQPKGDAPPSQTTDTKSYFTPPTRIRMSVPMPAVGSKRDVDGLEKVQHPNDDDGEADDDDERPKPKNTSVPMQPPTRQRRTSKAKCIDITQLDTPRTPPQFVFEHERPLERKPKTGQLTMTPFLPKIEVGDRAPSGSEIELVGHKAADHPVITLPVLLDVIDMKEVRTPANGSCWKYALVIAQAYECGDEVTTEMKTDVKEAFKVGATINNKLAGTVKGMIADGTLEMAHLCSTVLGKAVQHDSLKKLQDHFKDAAKQPADVGIHRKFWGGEPEFKVFVEWVKEPLYVLDVMPDGACFPQWYHIADVRSKDGSVVQRAIVTGVTEAAFRAHMAIYKRNHVVPLVLLLHHSAHGNTPVGHVTAARVSNATYKHWAGSKRRQADMTERLKKVIRELRGIDVNLSQHPFPTPSPPATPGSGSVYEPADGDSSMEEPPVVAGTTTASVAASTTPSGHAGPYQATPPSFELLAPSVTGTPLPHSVMSALSLDTQPDFGTATLDKMLPVSLAHMVGMPCGQREEALIKRLQTLPPYDTETTRQIKQVYKSNNTAYENWKARQKKDDPATHAIVKSINGPILACGALQDNVGAFVQLVQNLPYPEVHMATVPESVLLRVGQAAGCIAQAQLLHRVQGQLATSSQAFCSTWIDALVADSTPPSTRWQLSQASDRWKRLEHAAADTQIALPARSHHGVPDEAWYKMLAYLLAVPGCLPWAFSERSLPQRCDALATWLAMVEHTHIAQTTADAIDRRDWLAARNVFPSSDYGATGSSPMISPSRQHHGAEAVTPRN